jgi:hypothetical protein
VFCDVHPGDHPGNALTLYRITGKTYGGRLFCAAIGEGLCAPILKYMKGWTVRRIKAFCAERGWTIEVIQTKEPPP